MRIHLDLSRHGRLALFLSLFCIGGMICPVSAADGRRKNLIDPGESDTVPVLVRYYKTYIENEDAGMFEQNVLARYNEGALIRLLDSTDTDTRRAAVLSLGMVGGAASNAPVGELMKDDDPVVRSFAENSLWGIWNRSDTSENNLELTKIHQLMVDKKDDEALIRLNLLIEKSPRFAEAWNQRAIIHFSKGEWDKSIADCQKVVELNPYHYGAISGMAQCHLRADRPKEAVKAFRMLVVIQPHKTQSLSAIEAIERDMRRP